MYSEYEARELEAFYSTIRKVENAPLTDRQEARKELTYSLIHEPEEIIERIKWLLNGSCGYGSYVKAWEVARNTRMNRTAWFGTTIAAIEWLCPAAFAQAAWKKLTVANREALNAAIRAAVDEAVKEADAETVDEAASRA